MLHTIQSAGLTLLATTVCGLPIMAQAAAPIAATPTCTLAPAFAAAVAEPEVYDSNVSFSNTVKVQVSVDAQGRAHDARVLNGSRNRLLDDAARKAALSWQYLCQGQGGIAQPVVPVPEPACRLDRPSWADNEPRFSSALRSSGLRGSVEVWLRPMAGDPAGTEVKIGRSSGDARIDEALLTAARNWRLTCPRDTPVKHPWISFTQSFNFQPRSQLPAPAASEPAPDDVVIANDALLEFGTVAGFVEELPKMKGVDLAPDQSSQPGVTLYNTSLGAIMREIETTKGLLKPVTLTHWLVMVPPHRTAPAVVRTSKREVIDDTTGKSHMQTDISILCESGPAECAELRQRRDALILRSR